jgi:hypothetical protein
LEFNLIPYVVPELKGITIGGASSGCSLESMSYKVGGFHESCIEYEVITSSGDVINCNKTNHSDIFDMLHGSFGTLGIISKVTFKLCPAESYVKTSYWTFDSLEAFMTALQSEYNKPRHDFMDGIIHNEKQYVLIFGDFVSQAPYTSDYNHQKIFYRSTLIRHEDYMLTADYLFRYDRDCHWMSRRYGLENPVLRRLLGPRLLGSTNMIKTVKRNGWFLNRGRPLVTVDTMVSSDQFISFYEWIKQTLHYYPLWIVPYKITQPYPWFKPGFLNQKQQLYIDLAMYGMPQRGSDDIYKLIENKLYDIHGVKTLISLNSYDAEQFWKIYDKSAYDAVKRQVDPRHAFPDLYQKTHAVKRPQ